MILKERMKELCAPVYEWVKTMKYSKNDELEVNDLQLILSISAKFLFICAIAH
ncbi:MAG: hypothetical protein ACFFE6_14190 [Candidatus Thorarchaeota archaeon]